MPNSLFSADDGNLESNGDDEMLSLLLTRFADYRLLLLIVDRQHALLKLKQNGKKKKSPSARSRRESTANKLNTTKDDKG